MLSCCTAHTVTSDLAESAITTTTAIEQSLPKECATNAIKTQITALKTQITAIAQACDTEKNVITAEKVRWQWAFFGLLLVIAAYITRKVIK